MKNKIIKNKKPNKISKKLILSIILCILFIFAWLTKAWYIQNFLNINILCPGEEYKQEIFMPIIPSGWWGSIDKPVIYLYPESKTDILVNLDYKWEIFADYPKYDKNIKWWNVKAYPDSTIINKTDNKEYNYLFWEWIPSDNIDWDLSKGFIVKGIDSREFLQEILPKLWLTPKEYNEFIVYWYPIMQQNKYNLIHFAEEQYTNTAPLNIIPKPDSILRVFMVIKPLENKIEIEEQKIKTFNRKWFSVIEWGWTLLK